MMSNLLFLYGTVKSGQPNHSAIPVDGPGLCKCLGTGRTETKWPLVIATKYNLPFLLDCEGEGYNVQGEVYEIDDDILADIDKKEDQYDRRKVKIVMDKMADGSEPTTLECWFYLLPRFRQSLLTLEKHENYDSYGAHGQQYIQMYDLENSRWLEPMETVNKEFAQLKREEEELT
ncbi:putative gamma-glutamylcyclotransferase CG2811 [Lytechinus variegatus]|uniref:putative gamma-glutamylcyclotransferase CG2811 n=1 Tax=Lytechinus variegatus TaxID=7654 RepID=UPI001BB15DDC|nr:putative gamma-glutamylcyclotransferase CG2811 [Lytechinus variegatus]